MRLASRSWLAFFGSLAAKCRWANFTRRLGSRTNRYALTSSQRRRLSRSLCFEQAELRAMLSVTPSWNSGTGELSFGGDTVSFADTVTLAVNGSGNVTWNTVEISGPVAASAVTAIFIETGGGNDIVNLTAVLPANFSQLTDGAIEIYGQAGGDTIDGSPWADIIYGGTEGDTIRGRDGNDQLFGDAGVDWLLGGNGDDLLEGGVDSVNDILQGENDNDTLKGQGGSDTIQGNAGDDTFWVGAGGATFYGGTGDDHYIFDPVTGEATNTDTIRDDSGAGSDTLDFSLFSGSNVADVTAHLVGDGIAQTAVANKAKFKIFSNSAIENMTGGEGNDNLTGNTLNNTIIGGYGDDTLYGGLGADWIQGGGGDDLVEGGVDTSLDVLQGDAGDDILKGQGGADTILGNDGDDTFWIGAGDATFWGNVGNDLYLFDPATGDLSTDTIRDDAAQGIDTLDFSLFSGAAVANVTANLVANEVAQTTGGNKVKFKIRLSSEIENIIGGSGDDVLTGNSLGNLLVGGAGADSINGGSGNDRISGIEDEDTITDQEGEGDDQFDSNLSINEYAPVFEPIDNVTLRRTQNHAFRLLADDVETDYENLTFTIEEVKRNGQTFSLAGFQVQPFLIAEGNIFAFQWTAEDRNADGKADLLDLITEASAAYQITVRVEDVPDAQNTVNFDEFTFTLTIQNYNEAPPNFQAWSIELGENVLFTATDDYEELWRQYNLAFPAESHNPLNPLAPPDPNAFSIDSQTSFEDVDFALTGTLPSWATFDSETAIMTLDPPPGNISGNWPFEIAAIDNGNANDTPRETRRRFVLQSRSSMWNSAEAYLDVWAPRSAVDDHFISGINVTLEATEPNNVIGYQLPFPSEVIVNAIGKDKHDPYFPSIPTLTVISSPLHDVDFTIGDDGFFQYQPEQDGEGLDGFTYQTHQSEELVEPFDYFYHEVTSNVAEVTLEVGQAVRADIDIDVAYLNPDAVQERSIWHTLRNDDEDDLGAVLTINSDDDNSNDIPDNEELLGPVSGENDLIPVKLGYWLRDDVEITDLVARLHVSTAEPTIRIWDSPDKQNEIIPFRPLPGHVGKEWILDDLPERVWVEGFAQAESPQELKLEINGPGSAKFSDRVVPRGALPELVDSDVVKFFQFDLDIDSDNNNGFAHPAGTNWEEFLEVNPYGLGKLVMLDNPTRDETPLLVRLPQGLNPNDPRIRVRLDWANGAAGEIRLSTWPHDLGRNPNPIAQGGHEVIDGIDNSLSDLGYDPQTGLIDLYAIGVDENELIKTLAGVEQWGKPDERVKATLVLNGADAASDEVKYIVANEDSFFYHLQNRQEVRNELASRGVYDRQDMPNFSLQRLDAPDLAKLGIPGVIMDRLGPIAGNGVAGLNAALYQDYITGENQYVLAFAGTGDTIWESVWDDWINNIPQAFGNYAPQYVAAMEIGDALSQTPLIAGRVIVTGHSLGGGLASAASVVSGFHAHIFNAAGLHIDTLYQRDANGDPIPNGMGGYLELYAGSVARYNNAAALIDVYHMDWDILTFVQALPGIPDAIGNWQPELDGPFDSELFWTAALAGTALATGQYWVTAAGGATGLVYMIKSHKNVVLLYGLLYQESGWDVLGYDVYSQYF